MLKGYFQGLSVSTKARAPALNLRPSPNGCRRRDMFVL